MRKVPVEMASMMLLCALAQIYKVTLGRKFPMLTNYAVTIPPAGVPMPLCRRLLPGV